MSYRYLDANGPAAAPLRYEITVTVYHNCASTTDPRESASVGIYDQATGKMLVLKQVNYAYTTSFVDQTGVMSIPETSIGLCLSNAVPAGCSVTGPSQPYQVQKFTGIVRLPANSKGYYAEFTDGNRNVDVANLAGSEDETLILYVALDPPTLPNRSAVFADFALAVICAGDTTLLLNNATDADGDRLVYAFGQPYGAVADLGILPKNFQPPAPTTPYKAGYGIATPLGTGAGHLATIDPATGIARYATPVQGKYAVAVDVREYRTINGQEVLVGTTRRDLQLVVASCPNTKKPVLPPVATTPRNYVLEVGATLTIPLRVTQADGHPLTLTTTSELLDGAGGYAATLNGNAGTVATGSSTGTVVVSATSGSVTGNFVYKPGCGEARTTPYDVSVLVKDDGCAGKTIADIFRITVVKPTGPTAISGDQAVCGTAAHAYKASGGTATGVSWRVVGGSVVGSSTANPVQVSWTTAGTGRVIARGVGQFGCLTDSVALAVVVTLPTPATISLATPAAQCAGTTLSFAPVVANAGPAPTYAWFVNNVPVATTPTYSSSTLKNGDQVRVELTPTAGPCAAAKVSATVTVGVTTTTPATIRLATPAAQCAGTAFSFVPVVTNAGSAPTYAWFVNGTQVATTPTFSSSTLKNGDQLKVVLTPTAGACAAGAVSATVSITVTPTTPATISLAPPVAQCAGTTFRFAPVVTNAGSAPTYAWFVNGTQVATTPTFSSASLKNGDQVRVVLTPAASACATGPVSATVNISVITTTPATVSLATPAAQCAGTAFSFVPVVGNAGAAPTYVWFVNGTQVATTPTYSSSTLTNGDQVRVELTPTAGPCAAGKVSAAVRIGITALPRPTVVIGTKTRLPVCEGSAIVWQVTGSTDAGAAPTYQWLVNGAAVSGATGPTFSSTQVADGQAVSVVLNVATPCGAATATSNAVLAQVMPLVHVLAGPDKEITAGDQVVLEGQVNGPYLVQWTPAQSLTFVNGDTLRPLAAPLVTTVYTLRARAGDCTDESRVTVTVQPRLGIPSAISPNGDGQDDTWEIDHIGDYPANHVVVYNRWGSRIFESTGYGRGREWDGTIGGQPAPIGTYYYTITLENGKAYSGPLTVVY